MRNKCLTLQTLAVAMMGFLLVSVPGARAAQRTKSQAQLETPGNRDVHRTEMMKEEVRHQLVTLPYSRPRSRAASHIPWIVVDPSLLTVEARVKKLEGASHVVDNIEVLPLSTMDDELRLALYRSIYSYNSPLFRYATQSVPSIHIIVKNGHATLRGIVANQNDSQLAYMAASQVPGVFEVKNELQIEQRLDERISRK